VTLSLLTSPNQADVLMIQTLTEAYTALHPNVTFNLEVGMAGAEGDNLVKTRQAIDLMPRGEELRAQLERLLAGYRKLDTSADASQGLFPQPL
jgi:hypothetical protein